MAKQGSKTFLAFGDVHVPHQNVEAVAILRRVSERLRPDVVVCLGDLLDCGQFSTHPPTFGTPESDYVEDLKQANTLLDQLQASCGRLVMVEGSRPCLTGRSSRWPPA